MINDNKYADRVLPRFSSVSKHDIKNLSFQPNDGGY